jgi:hypothetical protein
MLVAQSASGSLQVSLGSGNAQFNDLTGASATIAGAAGASSLTLGSTGQLSITGGVGAMSITSAQSLGALTSNSSTAVGGTHTLTFGNGQTIVINDASSDVTIHFTGGGATTV